MSSESKINVSFSQITKFRGDRFPSENDISYEAWASLIYSGFEANGWLNFIKEGYKWEDQVPTEQELTIQYLLDCFRFNKKTR